MPVPPRRPWTALALTMALGLPFVCGCDQPTGSTRPKSNVPPAEVVEQDPPPAPVEKPREFIVGKTNQDIRDPEAEKQKGGVVTTPRITAKDPITLQGNAYVFAMGKIAIDQMKHAVDLYHATNGEYPKTLEEFMEQIIKPNNIKLPVLPPYQKFGYDAPTHSLIVIEYPDLK